MSKYYGKARKEHWTEKVIAVYNFHVERLRVDKSWTLQNTADELGRSLGTISQYIMLAHWLRTHENKLRSFKSSTAAIEWVKDKKRELEAL